MGSKFIEEKVTLPRYWSARNAIHYDIVESKLPEMMRDAISMDAGHFTKTFQKTSQATSSPRFEKIHNKIWVFTPSHYCFLSNVNINEIVEWGIAPQKGQPIRLQPCTNVAHGLYHDHLAPFHFTNPELLALYEDINSGHDETRKVGIQERFKALQDIWRDPSCGHENTCFHCTGHPINHTNYKEIDWTVRLFYAIKVQLDVHVKPSYSYGSNYSFPNLQQQISSCPTSGVYHFRGAPDLLFIKKRVPEASMASMLVSEDQVELFDLKQGTLSMPKNPSAGAANYPSIAGQVIAGLHFLTAAKTLKFITSNEGVPKQVKSKGLLVKRKDAMWLYNFTANINTTDLASTKMTIQDRYVFENFTLGHLCAGIQQLFVE